MSSAVYTLKYYYNEYGQLGGYTVAIFKDKPTFKVLKCWFEKHKDFYDEGDHQYIQYAKDIKSEGKTFDACIGMLSCGETVHECGGSGGDMWRIEEENLL